MIKNIEKIIKIKRENILKELKERGMTYEELGLIFKISRQRVFQIISKNKPKIVARKE